MKNLSVAVHTNTTKTYLHVHAITVKAAVKKNPVQTSSCDALSVGTVLNLDELGGPEKAGLISRPQYHTHSHRHVPSTLI